MKMWKKNNIQNNIVCIFVSLMMLTSLAHAELQANELQEEEPFVYDDKGKRDPLLGLVSREGVILNRDSDFIISDLTLEGIMAGKTADQSLAIINGVIVKKGDKIGDFVVTSIKLNSIVLMQGDQASELRLKKED